MLPAHFVTRLVENVSSFSSPPPPFPRNKPWNVLARNLDDEAPTAIITASLLQLFLPAAKPSGPRTVRVVVVVVVVGGGAV